MFYILEDYVETNDLLKFIPSWSNEKLTYYREIPEFSELALLLCTSFGTSFYD